MHVNEKQLLDIIEHHFRGFNYCCDNTVDAAEELLEALREFVTKTEWRTSMSKPDNPGGKGRDKDDSRDIDKWLQPKRAWVAVTIPAAAIVFKEILFDRATQEIEILGHQFDEDGKQIVRKLNVTVEETEAGASLIVSYPEVQVLYKIVDADEDDDDDDDRVLL